MGHWVTGHWRVTRRAATFRFRRIFRDVGRWSTFFEYAPKVSTSTLYTYRRSHVGGERERDANAIQRSNPGAAGLDGTSTKSHPLGYSAGFGLLDSPKSRGPQDSKLGRCKFPAPPVIWPSFQLLCMRCAS